MCTARNSVNVNIYTHLLFQRFQHDHFCYNTSWFSVQNITTSCTCEQLSETFYTTFFVLDYGKKVSAGIGTSVPLPFLKYLSVSLTTVICLLSHRSFLHWSSSASLSKDWSPAVKDHLSEASLCFKSFHLFILLFFFFWTPYWVLSRLMKVV